MTSFLQSREWQEIQERTGRPTARIGPVLVIRHRLPLGFHYLYAPRPRFLGPEFYPSALAHARLRGSLFLKVDPAEPSVPPLRFYAGASLQPRSCLGIDCTKRDSDLLAAMHPKTRYNIRLAERKGVLVRPVSHHQHSRALDEFGKILSETARRERFSLHPREYYRILLEVRSSDFENELWFAEAGGEAVAAALVNWFGPSRTLTYLHGGSLRLNREAMPSHLLHWRIIQEAQRRAYALYDFGGVDEKRWPGLTRFKKGFGGTVFNFPPSFDVVFRPFGYRLWRLARALRRLRFGYAVS